MIDSLMDAINFIHDYRRRNGGRCPKVLTLSTRAYAAIVSDPSVPQHMVPVVDTNPPTIMGVPIELIA